MKHSPSEFPLLLSFIVLAVIFGAIWVIRQVRSGDPATEEPWPLYAKPVLSEREQILYRRLVALYPDYLVFAQVALSQLVRVRYGTRNWRSIFARYSQLVADFVICRQDFTAVAVIELDDASHARSDRQDADRRKTKAVEAAGLRLVRIPAGPIPSDAEIRQILLLADPSSVPMVAEPRGAVYPSIGRNTAAVRRPLLKLLGVGVVIVGAWWIYSLAVSPLPKAARPPAKARAPVSVPKPPVPAASAVSVDVQAVAEQKRQEAERAMAAQQAADDLARRKQAAWAAFYQQPASCDHPPAWQDQVECGNQYIRARRDFEKVWAVQNGLPAPQ